MPLNQRYIQNHLKSSVFGQCIWCEDTVDSTFLSMKEKQEQGAPHGAVLTAETQLKGRGRLGRAWVSKKGAGLYFTLLLRPSMRTRCLSRLTPAMAVGVASALRALGYEAFIKWPNDIIIEGKKVCGILCEAGFNELGGVQYVMAGIGINVFADSIDESIEDKACYLLEFSCIDRETLLIEVLHHLEQSVGLCVEDFSGLLLKYKQLCITLGKRVQASGGQSVEGYAVDLSENGELIVLDDCGARHFLRAADVSVRGLMGYV